MIELALKRAQEIARNVVLALGGHDLFGVKLFVCGAEIIFSEVSPRPHDTGMVTLISQDLPEIALHCSCLSRATCRSYSPVWPLCLGCNSAAAYQPKCDRLITYRLRWELGFSGKPEIDGSSSIGHHTGNGGKY